MIDQLARSGRLAFVITLLAASLAIAATPKATYQFNDTFAAAEVGAPALTPIDPTGTSVFTTDTVFGSPHRVWAFNGTNANTDQSGMTVNTTGLVSPQSYSVDMVFEFFDRQNAWRRIIDVQNRQSDNGFYVDPSNNLDVFPVSGSTAAWTNNIYHHIVMTNDGATVSGYLDGISQFSAPTSELNLDFDPTNNPNRLMGFFIDNVAAGGQGEWSSGRVALVRLWNGVLTSQEAHDLATNPFPEPASAGIVLASVGICACHRRRR